MPVVDYMNDLRRRQGLLTVDEIVALGGRGNHIYDPHSLLIRGATGRDNVFFPNVTPFCSETGSLHIGDRSVSHAKRQTAYHPKA